MATYLELKAQAEELLRQAEEVRKKEVAQVVADIKEKMHGYGITAADLGFSDGPAKKTRRSSPSVVRYRGPSGEEWSGMGRQPVWLKQAVEQGKSKEDFAV